MRAAIAPGAAAHNIAQLVTGRTGGLPCLVLGGHRRTPQVTQTRHVMVHATKAVDVQDHADMATGWKVDPEGRVNKELNPREMVADCTTWQACAVLLNENPQRFERNRSLAYFLLVRLADLLGSSEDAEATLQRFTPPPESSSTGQHGEGAAGGGGLGSADPYADLLAREAQRSARRVVGAERQQAMQFVSKVVAMAVANMDQMRPDQVCGITFTLARLGLHDQQALKAVLLYVKSRPKRFKVAELYACIAACTAMGVRVPKTVTQALLEQAQRGFRFVTAADLDNVVYALHAMPRGAASHAQVNGIIRMARSKLFDMSGPALAYLVATIARQGYKPPLGFMAAVMEALGPHLESFKDPHVVVTLVFGLVSLRQEIHSGISNTVERVLTQPGKAGIGGVSADDLGLLGAVLASLGPAGTEAWAPSQELRDAYLQAVKDRLHEVDEKTAGAVLAGVAYMSQGSGSRPRSTGPAPAPVPTATAGLSASVSNRLAKLAAKKAKAAAPKPVVELGGMVSDLLVLVETRLGHMGGHALQQLATAVGQLQHTPEPVFATAFRQAVAHAVPRCGNFPSLIALASAAGVSSPDQLKLQGGAEGKLAPEQFALSVAAQAVHIAQGPATSTLTLEDDEPGGDGMAAAHSDMPADLQEPEQADPNQFLPSQEELAQLKAVLAALPGVDASALKLPEAAPPAPPPRAMGYNARRRNTWGGAGSSNSWVGDQDASDAWYDDSTGNAGGFQEAGDVGWRSGRRGGRNTRWEENGFQLDDSRQQADGPRWMDDGDDGWGQQRGWRQQRGANRNRSDRRGLNWGDGGAGWVDESSMEQGGDWVGGDSGFIGASTTRRPRQRDSWQGQQDGDDNGWFSGGQVRASAEEGGADAASTTTTTSTGAAAAEGTGEGPAGAGGAPSGEAGFDMMMTFAEDGMGDMGAWQGGAGGWADEDPNQAAATPAPQARKPPAAAAKKMDRNFVDLLGTLDDDSYGFESGGWAPDAADGFGDGPTPRGPSLDVFDAGDVGGAEGEQAAAGSAAETGAGSSAMGGEEVVASTRRSRSRSVSKAQDPADEDVPGEQGTPKKRGRSSSKSA